MAETRYHVVGMTCEHCVRSVSENVGEIPGVAEVAVELSTGALTVRGSEQVPGARVRAAVEEAGYQLSGRTDRSEGAA